MRITGGNLGGRRILVPNSLVRPTQDRVREALFSSLADRIRGARVLDLFAGTGALGIESWSRGAESITWVEDHRTVYRVLKKNVETLCGGEPGLSCVLDDVYRFLHQSEKDRMYDLVFADPPYQRDNSSASLRKLLRILESDSILAPTGCFIMEQDRDQAITEPVEWKLTRDRSYGNTRLLYYVRDRAAGGSTTS